MNQTLLMLLMVITLSSCGGGGSQSGSLSVMTDQPFLSLPITGYTHRTAPLSSVYDHSRVGQVSGEMIQAFDGTLADSAYGVKGNCYQTQELGAITLSNVFYHPSASASLDNVYLCTDEGEVTRYMLAAGDQIVAAASGVVTRVDENQQSRVATVHINHGNGFSSYYQDLALQSDLTIGESVNQGQLLGLVADNLNDFVFGVRKGCTSHIDHCDTNQGALVDPFGFQGAGVLWGDWSFSSPDTTELLHGIDVSRSRGFIDWQQVKQSGAVFFKIVVVFFDSA